MGLSRDEHDVLIVTAPQRDFCLGGALAVPHGDEIMAAVNRLARRFAHVVITQEWHSAGHTSFASAHVGRAPLDTVELDYGPQTLWPEHCYPDHHPQNIINSGSRLYKRFNEIKVGDRSSVEIFRRARNFQSSTSGRTGRRR